MYELSREWTLWKYIICRSPKFKVRLSIYELNLKILYQFEADDGSTVVNTDGLLVNLIIRNNITDSQLVDCSNELETISEISSTACNLHCPRV